MKDVQCYRKTEGNAEVEIMIGGCTILIGRKKREAQFVKEEGHISYFLHDLRVRARLRCRSGGIRLIK